MSDQGRIARANEIIERLFALDETVANAQAYRALLEELHARDISAVREPHVTAIGIVRGGILRALIGTVMACLDPSDWRGNRASVGQILEMINADASVVAAFPGPMDNAILGPAALRQAQQEYDAVVAGDSFRNGRQLRNDAIAHVLIPIRSTPSVPYEAIYSLHDACERLVVALYQVCYRGRPPQFLAHEAAFAEHARLFWATYFSGMSPS